MFFRLLKAKKNIPSFIFPFACLHLLKVKRCIPDKSVEEIIKDEKIEVLQKEMRVKGKYENGKIIVNPHFIDEEKEIILHELFHYFEEKNDLKASKIVSEAAARLYSRISY